MSKLGWARNSMGQAFILFSSTSPTPALFLLLFLPFPPSKKHCLSFCSHSAQMSPPPGSLPALLSVLASELWGSTCRLCLARLLDRKLRDGRTGTPLCHRISSTQHAAGSKGPDLLNIHLCHPPLALKYTRGQPLGRPERF